MYTYVNNNQDQYLLFITYVTYVILVKLVKLNYAESSF